jgi:hypothetical protein
LPYNVLVDPWIPMMNADGERKWFGLKDVLTGGVSGWTISHNGPDLTWGTYELCFALVQKHMQPADEQEWKRRFDSPLTPEEYDGVFLPHLDDYNVDGEGKRFLQDEEMRKNKEEPALILEMVKSYQRTVRCLYGKQNLDNMSEENKHICVLCAVPLLYLLQAYTAGGGSGRMSSPRHGKMPTFVHNYDLRKGIWLNVVCELFEQEKQLNEIDEGFASGMFIKTRRIWLHVKRDGSTCDICKHQHNRAVSVVFKIGMKGGEAGKEYFYSQLEKESRWFSPYAITYLQNPIPVKGNAREYHKPQNYLKSRLPIWSYFDEMFAHIKDTGAKVKTEKKYSKALVVQQASVFEDDGIISSQDFSGIIIAGLVLDGDKYADIFFNRYTFSRDKVAWSEFEKQLIDLLFIVKRSWQALEGGVKAFFRVLDDPERKKLGKKDVDKMSRRCSQEASRRFWVWIEDDFWQVLGRVGVGEMASKVWLESHATAWRQELERIYNAVVETTDLQGREMKARVAGRGAFHNKFNKLVEQKKEEVAYELVD